MYFQRSVKVHVSPLPLERFFSLSFLINQLNFLLLTKVRIALFTNSWQAHFAWDFENVASLIPFPRVCREYLGLTKFPLP